MAIKFQYNKTSLTNLGKQLKVRQNALPTLKNKESALRASVIVAKQEAEKLAQELKDSLKEYDYLAALWNEFDIHDLYQSGLELIPKCCQVIIFLK